MPLQMVTIEGNVGAGKTTIASLVASGFKAADELPGPLGGELAQPGKIQHLHKVLGTTPLTESQPQPLFPEWRP